MRENSNGRADGCCGCYKLFRFIGTSSRFMWCLSVRTGLLMISAAVLVASCLVLLSVNRWEIFKSAGETVSKFEDVHHATQLARSFAIAQSPKAERLNKMSLFDLLAMFNTTTQMDNVSQMDNALNDTSLPNVVEQSKRAAWNLASEASRNITLQDLHHRFMPSLMSQIVYFVDLFDATYDVAKGVRNWVSVLYCGNISVMIQCCLVLYGCIRPGPCALLTAVFCSASWLVFASVSTLIGLPIWGKIIGLMAQVEWISIFMYYALVIILLTVPMYYFELNASYYRIYLAGGSGREMKSHTIIAADQREGELDLLTDSEMSSDADEPTDEWPLISASMSRNFRSP
eukprot:GHVO01023777.1.p1 GENE.GHVO01023777.1~~GHVO01023777.1.p1  ORF type:complete len:344 (-),score=39.21 GHVO01023777.1:216-1247(-)